MWYRVARRETHACTTWTLPWHLPRDRCLKRLQWRCVDTEKAQPKDRAGSPWSGKMAGSLSFERHLVGARLDSFPIVA